MMTALIVLVAGLLGAVVYWLRRIMLQIAELRGFLYYAIYTDWPMQTLGQGDSQAHPPPYNVLKDVRDLLDAVRLGQQVSHELATDEARANARVRLGL